MCSVAPGTCPQLTTLTLATQVQPLPSQREREITAGASGIIIEAAYNVLNAFSEAKCSVWPEIMGAACHWGRLSAPVPRDSSLPPRVALLSSLGKGHWIKNRNICHLTHSSLVILNLLAMDPIQR